jgi:3D (Asp-Asp-Asp) domain-containing protein
MVLETLVLGSLMVTAYRSVPEQTDSSPNWTSIGEHVSKYGCAVSQDLLASGKVMYGDILAVEGIGTCVVNDCTHSRHTNLVDKWVSTHAEEKAIVPKKRQVLRIRSVQK